METIDEKLKLNPLQIHNIKPKPCYEEGAREGGLFPINEMGPKRNEIAISLLSRKF